MNNITLSNAIGLLEELISNGNKNPLYLVNWFYGEEDLIKRTLEELKYYEEEKRIYG